MGRFFGKPTKLVRHVTDNTYTIGPQRAQIIPFWYYDSTATSRTDGQDLADEFKMPEGSRITKHKLEMLVTPYTIEPQKLFIGRVKLSFNDMYAPSVCGTKFSVSSYQTTPTGANATNYIQIYPDSNEKANNNMTTDTDLGGIDTVLLDDHFKHWINLKKAIVYDQRPLMSDKFQRVPSKVKRVNKGTFYGLFVFNDSVRGATPADTQVDINVKQYLEEWAL
jgi:hypothetical protein